VSDVGARAAIELKVRARAMALVNESAAGPPSELRAHPHGICLRYPPAT
jgi:hypothetical protein